MVSQLYDTDVNKAYIIRGNAAVLKCEIPSFVADFVSVVSWHTDQEDEHFYPGANYGWFSFGFSIVLGRDTWDTERNEWVFSTCIIVINYPNLTRSSPTHPSSS